MAVLPRPSLKEEGKASAPVPSNGRRGVLGKSLQKFFLAAALVIALVSAYVAFAYNVFASAPAATPSLTNSNASLLPQNREEVVGL